MTSFGKRIGTTDMSSIKMASVDRFNMRFTPFYGKGKREGAFSFKMRYNTSCFLAYYDGNKM